MSRNEKIPRVPSFPDILNREPIAPQTERTIVFGEEGKENVPMYVQDLSLDFILSRTVELSMPKWKEGLKRKNIYSGEHEERVTKTIARRIIEDIFRAPPSIAAAEFRLNVFDYLLSNKVGLNNFNRIFDNLVKLRMGSRESDPNSDAEIWSYISNYDLIFDITEYYVPFGKEAPEALQRIDLYFDELRKSHAHRKMGELAEKLKGGHDINLRIRIDRSKKDFGEEHPKVVSASVVRASKFTGEFGDQFILDEKYLSKDRWNDERENVVNKILGRAIRLKYDRHLADTAGHITNTARLLEPMLFYAGYLKFMEEAEKKGVKFCRPSFNGGGVVKDAKHPLVTTIPIVGNDISYDENSNLRVLTGPNNGGKTTYAKTVGLVHALAQIGFYVPASQADIRFVDRIHTHFVKPDDITLAEGMYKNEMRRIKEIFDYVTPSGLVILDEPCRGTTLEAGQEVTTNFLKVFKKIGSTVYLTTHMSGVANAVESGNIPGAMNLHLDMKDDGTPTYHLREGPSPMDYGKFIPQQMGLDYSALEKRLEKRAAKEGFSLRQ